MKKRGHQGVSNTEFAVLKALWQADKPLPRPDILAGMPSMDWNPNSIHLVLNGLMDKGLIRVEGLVRCGQSYGRCYAATVTQLEYAAEQALKALADLPSKERLVGLFAAMIDREDIDEETFDALEEMLQQKRSKPTAAAPGENDA